MVNILSILVNYKTLCITQVFRRRPALATGYLKSAVVVYTGSTLHQGAAVLQEGNDNNPAGITCHLIVCTLSLSGHPERGGSLRAGSLAPVTGDAFALFAPATGSGMRRS